MEPDVFANMGKVEQRHWWFCARRKILADQIEQLALPDTAHLLEVGCGTGGNLSMLSRFGKVVAVEPDDAARHHAQQQSGQEILSGFLPHHLPAAAYDADLAVALDVIEHVEDDRAAVAAISRCLKPGGHFLATVPAYQWMWSGHDVAHHHKRRYRRLAFTQLFLDAGLTIRKSSYFNTFLFPPIAAARLLGWAVDGEAVPSAPLNKALQAIFSAERLLLRDGALPFGVSILVVAERPLAP